MGEALWVWVGRRGVWVVRRGAFAVRRGVWAVNRISRLPEGRRGGYAEIVRAAKERRVSLSGACGTSTTI